MLRRYLVAFVGAIIGGGAVLGIHLALGRIPGYLVVGAGALGAAGFLMAKGESLGLVPPSEEIDKPTSLFSDEKGNRR